MSALTLSAAAPQAKKKSAPATQKPAATTVPKTGDASKPMAIPSDAVLGEDGDYHYADPQGKKWIYRKTPFGVTRMEDSPERAAAKAAAPKKVDAPSADAKKPADAPKVEAKKDDVKKDAPKK